MKKGVSHGDVLYSMIPIFRISITSSLILNYKDYQWSPSYPNVSRQLETAQDDSDRSTLKMSNFAIAQGIIVLIGILVYSLFFRKKREVLLPLPPGPKPLPILGNIRDVPAPGQPEYEYWLSLKEKYGPINSTTVLGHTQVFIYDRAAITELLEKSSLKTASRPQMDFLDLCGYDRWLSIMRYNTQHKFFRKIIHQQIGTKLLSTQYIDIQDVESKRFLLRALLDPTHLFRHAKTYDDIPKLDPPDGLSNSL